MICFRVLLQICYLPLRLFLKPENKIVFLSRQVKVASKDFVMLSEEIKRISPETKVVILCKMIEKSFPEKVGYFFHMFKQMYHLATAKAAVLDGYCITACLLNHRKELKIYQIWHALGLLKNFAYSALGSKEGTTERTAKIMRMHKGYHKIICSSPDIITKIAACYDAPPEKMMPVGLPRIDFLNSAHKLNLTRAKIFNDYTCLDNGKQNILYVPTLRKNLDISTEELEKAVDFNKYNLIIKKHSGYEKVLTNDEVSMNSTSFTGLEWLAAADFVVTDYSAIIFEAMVANRPVFLYCFDRKQYNVSRGFAVPYDSIPAAKCETAAELMKEINSYIHDATACEKFLDYHVFARKLETTKALAFLITEEIYGKTVTYDMLKKDFSLQNGAVELK